MYKQAFMGRISWPVTSKLNFLGKTFKRTLFASLMAVTLVVPINLAMSSALQAQESSLHIFAVPAGSLETALVSFSSTTGLTVSFAPEVVKGLRSVGLQGEFSAADALLKLLEGTGLQVRTSANGSYSIFDGSTTNKKGAMVLPPVKVDGEVLEVANGPIQGYVAKRSATATKTDTVITEIPQSISVIGQKEIKAKGMRDLLDALNYTPSIFTRGWGQDDRAYEWYTTIRGFRSDFDTPNNYLDGLAQIGYVDTVPITELYGLERVEVLRGPASTTFGRGDVGGVINRVSKRPSPTNDISEVLIEAGNFNLRRFAFDYGNSIADNLSYRIVGVGRSADDQAKYPNGVTVKTERQYFAPSLLWQLSPDTALTFLSSFIRHDAGDDAGYISDINGQSTNVREGDPDYSRIVQKAWSIGYELQHTFNETWSFQQKFRYVDRETEKNHILPASLQSDGRTVFRGASSNEGELQQSALDSFIQANFGTDMTEHQIAFGIDWSRLDGESKTRNGPAPDLDLLNPIYLPITSPTIPGATLGPYNIDSVGIYVQDQAKINKQWVVTLSGRYDTVDAEDETSWRAGPVSREDSAFTGRAGLTWLAPNGWAPYFSFGTSFHSAIGPYDSFDDQPTKGRQWEAGVKFEPSNRNLLLTAAVFELDKKNILVSNPVTNISEQVGRIRSRGIELEAKGELTRELLATASYSYTNVEGLEGNTWYVQEGKEPIMAPDHLASLWLDYSPVEGPLAGMSMGAGVRYVGERWDDAANTQSQGSYTLVDANLSYNISNDWRVSLKANNLFNRSYFTSNAFNTWYRGEQRSVTLTALYNW